jgi:hypothetical protein
MENLHPILGPLGQLFLTNINFSKFSICNQHLLRSISTLAKELKNYVSICDSTMFKIWWVRKPIVRNIVSHFSHHWRKHIWRPKNVNCNWKIISNDICLLQNLVVNDNFSSNQLDEQTM